MSEGIDPRRLLGERRKRLVGSIMQFAERELYPGMSLKQQAAFRDKVMEAVGSYHDLMIDLMRSLAGDAVVNEQALSLLRDIHDRLPRT